MDACEQAQALRRPAARDAGGRRRCASPSPLSRPSSQNVTLGANISDSAKLPPEGLPPNAAFSFKGRVFYFIRHNYSHDENMEFRSALRETYDCIAHNAAPITATYDGSVVRFTRNWTSIIQSQGAKGASETLGEIERQATHANAQLLNVLQKRPYFRSDLPMLIGAPQGPNDLRDAIHKYQLALKSVPDKPTQELIALALGELEKRLETAATAHLAWIAELNVKINGARDELEALEKLKYSGDGNPEGIELLIGDDKPFHRLQGETT